MRKTPSLGASQTIEKEDRSLVIAIHFSEGCSGKHVAARQWPEKAATHPFGLQVPWVVLLFRVQQLQRPVTRPPGEEAAVSRRIWLLLPWGHGNAVQQCHGLFLLHFLRV